jgi:serine/threonine-protein kinase MRCK
MASPDRLKIAEARLREMEEIFLGGPIRANGQCLSVESLLDVLLVLYDECCNSSLRREKTVSEFIESGTILSDKILGPRF